MRHDSTQYVEVTLAVPAGNDITGDQVDIALVDRALNDVAEGEWMPAVFASGTTWRTLIGPTPGVKQFPTGTYHVFARIHDVPEVVVIRCPGLFVID